MAAYDNLRAVIAANVFQNNENRVTADMVKTAMNEMVNSLGAEFQFGGVAEPGDAGPGTPDYKVAYLASTPGTYTNFDGIVVADGEVVNLKWDGTAWNKEVTGAAARSEFRPFASMGASAVGAYFLDRNMVFSSTLYEYVESGTFDTAWMNVLPGATKVSVSGATPFAFRFFSSNETLNASTNLGSNTTGVIPLGAKLV